MPSWPFSVTVLRLSATVANVQEGARGPSDQLLWTPDMADGALAASGQFPDSGSQGVEPGRRAAEGSSVEGWQQRQGEGDETGPSGDEAAGERSGASIPEAEEAESTAAAAAPAVAAAAAAAAADFEDNGATLLPEPSSASAPASTGMDSALDSTSTDCLSVAEATSKEVGALSGEEEGLEDVAVDVFESDAPADEAVPVCGGVGGPSASTGAASAAGDGGESAKDGTDERDRCMALGEARGGEIVAPDTPAASATCTGRSGASHAVEGAHHQQKS